MEPNKILLQDLTEDYKEELCEPLNDIQLMDKFNEYRDQPNIFVQKHIRYPNDIYKQNGNEKDFHNEEIKFLDEQFKEALH